MKIYLLRHGQTDWNRDGKFAYNKNLELNETGVKQAETAKKVLENVNYNFVIASPFIRAIKAYILGIPADGNIRDYGIKNGELEEYII